MTRFVATASLAMLAFLPFAAIAQAAPDPLVPRPVTTEVIHPDAAPIEPDKADPGKAAGDAFDRRLFAREINAGGKTYACFVRNYDATHLAKHPKQKVRAMKLLVSAEVVPEDEKLNHSFRLAVKLRKDATNYESAGECGHAGITETPNEKPHLGCSVDCDGGGLTIEMADDNKSAVVKLERLRLWIANKPDDDDPHGLEAGVDDRVFRLDRAPTDMCRSLASDREELAAMHLK